MKLLLIEDDEAVALVLSEAFTSGGHETAVTHTGEDGLAYLTRERPDAVVTTRFGREDVPALEAELSEAIARIQAGDFRPTPSEFACAGCPALDRVCAGPRLLSVQVPAEYAEV